MGQQRVVTGKSDPVYLVRAPLWSTKYRRLMDKVMVKEETDSYPHLSILANSIQMKHRSPSNSGYASFGDYKLQNN